MKVNKQAIAVSFLLSALSFQAFAQNTAAEPLDSLLMYLEDRFDVVFTFADANVGGVYVAVPTYDLALEALLAEIEKQTNLHFQFVNTRYIAVQKKVSRTTVSGTIIDRSTGEKLEAAAIYSGDNHTISDKNGFFFLEVKAGKEAVLVIRHLGYHTLSLEQEDWGRDSTVYGLVPAVQKLEEVRLDYISRGIRKLPDGAVRLNVQNLEVLPGLAQPDVLQVIQILPGIQSINETVSEINTRGGSNDQNLVLWDGVKMYQTGHFFGLISAFNSHLIHQAKVIKNGTSAAYDEGISGTIDMQQQDYLVNEMEFSTGMDMLAADFIAKVPVTQKFSFILGARHSISNLLKTPTYKSYYKRAFAHTGVMLTQPGADTTVDTYHDFSFYDVSARLMYDISGKDKVRLSILNNRNTIAFEERATIRDTLYTRESRLRQWNLLSNLGYTRTWSEDHTTQLSAFVSNYQLEGSNVSISGDQFHVQENEVLDWGMKLESKNRIWRRAELLSGYQFREVGIRNLDNLLKPNYSREVKDVLRIHSLYTEAEFTELLKNLYVRTGMRFNYYSKFNHFSIEPRVAIKYRLSNHFSLEVLAEKKSQHTTQLIDYQTDFLGIENRRWVLSNNESVPLLFSRQLSAGIQYNRNNLLVSVEGYLKHVTGIITPSQGFQNQLQYVYSIGDYYARGVEFLVNKRFSHANTWVTYTLARNNYFFPEFTPSIFPNNLDIRHALSMGGSFTFDNFELSAGFNYRTGKPYTRPAQDQLNERNEITYEAPNSARLGDYIRLDISGNYTLKVKQVNGQLGISIWNVLNRDNPYKIFYRVNEENEIAQITRYTLGFTPNVVLRFRF
ncbi:MAG: TonB-dependent receptor plug domain-containing protein [Bacteroidales bacterium]|nr:TonB-dependent receptor plug domain-containing protein [Bacteroidales bacterium]MDT8430980.1 TonB-dependent receptor plug domain-containing protein [Bacteroidales bacterium]